ncbi:hypothetical protein [Desulfobacter sp.]|uniref:hypothetical protein n=1 Tax=Desulfobacter sp. TaxID=2294 RepID=UPI003D0F0233
MLPIRNFSDIIGFMKTYQRLIAPPFNIIILYKTEHMEFRQYIIRQFEKIHHETQNISCIIVDTPPITWTTTKDYKEYFEIVGNDYKPALNDFEVDMICRYMDIPAESLPCLVCFKNIEKHNFNCFSFSSSSMDEIRDFFDSFLEKTSMYSHQGREYVRTMIELGKEFPKCRKFIDWNRNNPIETRLSTALNAIEDYRKPRKLTPPIEEAGGFEAYVLGEDAYEFQPCAPPEIINNEELSAVNVPDAPSENAQITPKQMVIQCCRATAQKLVDQNPDITLPEILKTDEFKKSYEGKEEYIPESDSGWRNWLKGIYSDKRGRKKGS